MSDSTKPILVYNLSVLLSCLTAQSPFWSTIYQSYCYVWQQKAHFVLQFISPSVMSDSTKPILFYNLSVLLLCLTAQSPCSASYKSYCYVSQYNAHFVLQADSKSYCHVWWHKACIVLQAISPIVMADGTKPVLFYKLSVLLFCLTAQGPYCSTSWLSSIVMSDGTKPVLFYKLSVI